MNKYEHDEQGEDAKASDEMIEAYEKAARKIKAIFLIFAVIAVFLAIAYFELY